MKTDKLITIIIVVVLLVWGVNYLQKKTGGARTGWTAQEFTATTNRINTIDLMITKENPNAQGNIYVWVKDSLTNPDSMTATIITPDMVSARIGSFPFVNNYVKIKDIMVDTQIGKKYYIITSIPQDYTIWLNILYPENMYIGWDIVNGYPSLWLVGGNEDIYYIFDAGGNCNTQCKTCEELASVKSRWLADSTDCTQPDLMNCIDYLRTNYNSEFLRYSSNQCSTCTPNCAGKVCGDNGCGGSCGSCQLGQSCSGGVCITGLCSGSSTKPCTIGTCAGTQTRICNGGIWSSFGSCIKTDSNCGTCTDTCTSKGFECGTQTICGESANCGTCQTGESCTNGQCVDSDCVATNTKYEVKCYQNDVYYYDNCGNLNDRAVDCDSGCSDNKCKTSTCEFYQDPKDCTKIATWVYIAGGFIVFMMIMMMMKK